MNITDFLLKALSQKNKTRATYVAIFCGMGIGAYASIYSWGWIANKFVLKEAYAGHVSEQIQKNLSLEQAVLLQNISILEDRQERETDPIKRKRWDSRLDRANTRYDLLDQKLINGIK